MLGFVSPKGTTSWHTILSPTRFGVSKFTDLTELETLELWVTAKQVMHKIEERHRIRSFQVTIQDGGPGEVAVMMHLIPRIQGESPRHKADEAKDT